MTIPEIIKKYREQQGLSQQAFADALVHIPGGDLTKQSVSYWENGTQNPGYYFLLVITLLYDDWRRDMALECLAVLKPELYAQETLDA
jgi:transcriptional regulator with XRE-family HTH domain